MEKKSLFRVSFSISEDDEVSVMVGANDYVDAIKVAMMSGVDRVGDFFGDLGDKITIEKVDEVWF